MPRFLVVDRPELWRRLENSALRRDGVEIVLARSACEMARLARGGAFDAVLTEAGADASAAERELLGAGPAGGAPRLVAWEAGCQALEIARRLGLECRRLPRSRCALRVEGEDLRAVAKDASPEGLFLVGAPDLPVGARLEVSLRPPGGRRRARATLEVVRRVVEAEGSHRLGGLGVRVIPAAVADAERLREWLRERGAEDDESATAGS